MKPAGSGFDKLARAYRWMEYGSFGPLLQRCRVEFLPSMGEARRALLIGDGDGRFCEALLRANAGVRVTAVDESARMLHALRARCGDRVSTVRMDARAGLPEGGVDLVCTHFFLDCLTEGEVEVLAARVRERCPRGVWVVSEFAVPGGVAGWSAEVVVGGLYRVFGVLTGLRVRQLPAYAAAMERHGFVCRRVRTRLFGMLRSELWASNASGGEYGD